MPFWEPTEGARLPRVDLDARVLTAELEACGRVAYRVAHELGNIVAAVAGNADLLTRGCDEASPVRRRAANIAKAIGHAADLSRHMELFLGHPSRDDQPLDLRALLRGAELERLLRALPRPIPVVLDSSATEGDLPQPYASRERWRLALAALLANAGDALVDRPGRAAVRVDCVDLAAENLRGLLRAPRMGPGRYVRVAVADEGAGIADDALPHIFAPAFSTRMRQAGFGLSDTYGIVCRQHGGGIGIWTAPGEGTCVALFLSADRPRPATL